MRPPPPHRLVAALALTAAAAGLVACDAWPPPPEVAAPVSDVVRYRLLDETGRAYGDSRVGVDAAGRRVEHLSARLDGLDRRLTAVRGADGADLRWTGRWEVGPQVTRISVTREDGEAVTTVRRGLAVHRTRAEATEAPLLWSQALAPTADPVVSATLWEDVARRLAEVEDRARLTTLDPMRGRPVALTAEVRERTTVRLGNADVAARRLFVASAATGRTFWIADDGRLLAVHPSIGGLRLERAGLRIPERPRAVRPAAVVEQEVRLERDDVRLAGTVSRPAAGPREGRPALLLLHGSGPMDRDAAPFMIFRDLAWHLSARGWPVVRYDKRGVRDSEFTSDDRSAVLGDLAGDAAAWVDFIVSRPDLPRCVVLIGASEGGYLAPMVAARRDAVAGVGLLAGPVDPLTEVMADQLRRILEAHGATEEEIRASEAMQKASFDLMLRSADPPKSTPGVEAETVAWLRSHAAHDPVSPLQALDVPLLALFGADDVQVPPAQAARLREVLGPARPDVRIEMLPGIDHLMMRSPGRPGLAALADPDRRVAPEVLDTVTEWLEGLRCPTPAPSSQG